MRPKDTSPEVHAIQLRIWQSMTGAQRVHLAIEMSEFARALSKARIRKEHPEWPESEVTRQLIRELYPNDIPENF
jgi:hypothetical protein